MVVKNNLRKFTVMEFFNLFLTGVSYNYNNVYKINILTNWSRCEIYQVQHTEKHFITSTHDKQHYLQKETNLLSFTIK